MPTRFSKEIPPITQSYQPTPSTHTCWQRERGRRNRLPVRATIAHSSPSHQKTMSAVERANHSVMNKIRKLFDYGNNPRDKVFAYLLLHKTSIIVILKPLNIFFKYHKLSILDIDIKLNQKEKKNQLNELWSRREALITKYRQWDIIKGKTSCKGFFYFRDNVMIFKKRIIKREPNWHA